MDSTFTRTLGGESDRKLAQESSKRILLRDFYCTSDTFPLRKITFMSL